MPNFKKYLYVNKNKQILINLLVIIEKKIWYNIFKYSLKRKKNEKKRKS